MVWLSVQRRTLEATWRPLKRDQGADRSRDENIRHGRMREREEWNRLIKTVRSHKTL